MMMPSRGLAATNAVKLSSRRFISTCTPRSIHTSIRSSLQPLSSSSLLQKTSPWTSGRGLLAASSISLATQSRLASTTAATSTATATAPATSTTAEAAPIDAAAQSVTDSLGLSSIDFASLPERVGYLKDIGIDYGWGPTSMIQFVLEHFHVTAGLPWWGAIIGTAVVSRVALFPLFLRSSDVSARQAAIAPIVKPINDKMMAAYKDSDVKTVQLCRQELKVVYERAGIKMSALFLPMLFQGVFGFCAFRLLRAMSTLPVPSLETGGFGWVMDLTHSDPYYLLPAIMAVSMHLVFRFGGESGTPIQANFRPIMLYAMPAIILLTTTWLPGSVNLYMSTTGLLGIAQVQALRSPTVRDFLKLAPILPTDPRSPQYKAPSTTSSSSSSSASKPTIDVKATSRPYSSDAAPHSFKYQAPVIRTSAPATPDLVSETQEPQEKPTLKARVRESLTSSLNSVGEAWENAKAQGSSMAGDKAKKQSKTRSAEYLKQAREYEKKWQAANKVRR